MYYPAAAAGSVFIYQRAEISAPEVLRAGVIMTLVAVAVLMIFAVPYWNAIGEGTDRGRVSCVLREDDGMNQGEIPAEPENAMDEVSLPPLSRRAEQPDVYAPDGSEIRLLTDGRHSASKSSMVEVVLPAGQVSRPVYHRTVEETWYILEGRGRVCAARRTPMPLPLRRRMSWRGDALVIPTGWRFQFAASSEESLRFLCHTTPPWPGEDEAVPADTGGLGEPTV